MAIDVIQEIKDNLGNTEVPKIDPNTQEPIKQEQLNPNVESAAIPVVLAGFYKNTRSAENAEKIMQQDGTEILNNLFKENTNPVIQAVADYAKSDTGDAKNAMQKTVGAIKKILKENLKDSNGIEIMNFFTDQRSNILKHLPGELHIGELLNDTTIDDNTNKMEGPMSGLMHGIEKIFSSSK